MTVSSTIHAEEAQPIATETTNTPSESETTTETTTENTSNSNEQTTDTTTAEETTSANDPIKIEYDEATDIHSAENGSIIPIGNVSFGKAISNIKMSETKAVVYGSSESLENLNFIPIEVDVTDLAVDTQYKLEIPKPVGVKSLSVNNITVDISLDNVSDRDINNVAIETRNLGSDLKASAVSSVDSSVTVNIKGVSSVIDSITADNISAYVDLTGYTEGEYEVDVAVEGSDVRVQYVTKTKKVKIKITKK